MFVFDEKFIKDLIGFKHHAYNVFYHRYYMFMLRYAMTFMSNVQDTKDVVSDVILRLKIDLNAIDFNDMSTEDHFKRWLMTNVKHRCYRVLNKLNKRNDKEFITDMEVLHSSEDFNYEISIDMHIIFDDELREIFVMKYVLGFTVEEIGDHLKMHISSVKRRLSKIEDVLRKYYGG